MASKRYFQVFADTGGIFTDPEIVEHRYPVRLEQFSILKNSGRKGKWREAREVNREITILEPVSLSALAQRRREGPDFVFKRIQG